MTPRKFRQKPVVIEAMQWDGTRTAAYEVMAWAHYGLPAAANSIVGLNDGWLSIRTLEGDMSASIGDWIIKGVNGEFYPCKPDIFAKTYEEAE